MPHEVARGSWSPNARLMGPRTPEDARRQAGQRESGRDPEIAAHEQLDTDGQEHDADDADQRQRRPVVHAHEPDVVRRPGERAQDHERSADLHAGGDPQEDHGDAGDSRGAGAAEDGRQRERDPAEEHGEEPDPQGEGDGGLERDGVAEGGIPEDRRAERGDDGEDRQRQPHHRQVGRQLLEGDAALAERRGGDQVEAAATCLARERAGEGHDRPQRDAQGEDGAVLERHVAAERAEIRPACRTG